MSELIEQSRAADIRRQLLVTASALALTAYIATTDAAKAEDSRPTVWIELGGQMEQVQGNSAPFSAPFMTALSPTPDVYAGDIFDRTQKSPKFGFGAEGKVSFEPQGSNWIFSAGLRYGRSQDSHHLHQQGPYATGTRGGYPTTLFFAPFADSKSASDETHAILDFTVGKDVGLGRLGSNGTSVVSAGVRFAQFSSKLDTTARGRPKVDVLNTNSNGAHFAVPTFHNYTMFASAERSFHGVGPSLSWNASAALAGSRDDGELTLDWGVNGALLFGRQKVKGHHTTQAYLMPYTPYALYVGYYYTKLYERPHPIARSRSVVVPNVGGFAGISARYRNAKVSLGYRADFFFGAMDTGIDARHTKNLGFSGPFATISIGLGG